MDKPDKRFQKMDIFTRVSMQRLRHIEYFSRFWNDVSMINQHRSILNGERMIINRSLELVSARTFRFTARDYRDGKWLQTDQTVQVLSA